MVLTGALTLKRLNIGNYGIEIVKFSKISEAIDRVQQERFDIILVDSLTEEAGKACQYMFKIACAPVALLVRENDNDWKKLSNLEVDGFIFERSGSTEMIARIRAISRRRIMASRT